MIASPTPVLVAIVFLLAGVLFWFGTVVLPCGLRPILVSDRVLGGDSTRPSDTSEFFQEMVSGLSAVRRYRWKWGGGHRPRSVRRQWIEGPTQIGG
ncbi:hypothetical protein PX52LOC_01853 [Limnoglobus roseus]|uniref:Uncharacterized protein n=1 Tax=Limnoglobus roseus TaxID=2598579 RepID=A0A5C1A877_9BACT|nr:hypothetical protein PX52LOC_01853 [Limnoglobus roseus]